MTVPASTSITTQVTTHMATPEYEVESILRAKVFMRGKKMGWKFYVKWKGYEDADNTWEPFKSFENSGEGIVDRFWERVDTKGRDVDSIEGWTNGEEVFPTGPPRMLPFIARCPSVIHSSSRPKGQATA
ncbi:hypothetical protein EDB86DRAFT_2882438 [Lactarius hatsudake]|nr:hypothetical protein EDB86DRAFT_2882438 [Lactarius hatsudake]